MTEEPAGVAAVAAARVCGLVWLRSHWAMISASREDTITVLMECWQRQVMDTSEGRREGDAASRPSGRNSLRCPKESSRTGGLLS